VPHPFRSLIAERVGDHERQVGLPPFRYTSYIVDSKKLDPVELEKRKAAMMAAVGIWKDRTDLPDTETYVRNLRKGTRLARLIAQWKSDKPDSDHDER
jgi:hypothetical protein